MIGMRSDRVWRLPIMTFCICQYSTTKVVGKTTMHMAAIKQVTGVATYIDDIPLHANELYGALVMSTKAHAQIKSVNASAARAVPGVVGFVSHMDVPGKNAIGPVFHDELVFAVDEVQFYGQPIGMVVAQTQMDAQEAAKLVQVEYEELPAIVTIEVGDERCRIYWELFVYLPFHAS